MIARISTLTILLCSVLLAGCSTPGSVNKNNWGKCAAVGGAVWGIPGAVHGLATGGVSLAAGALISGVACAVSSEEVIDHVLPAPGREGTTVARFKFDSAYLDSSSKAGISKFLEGRKNSTFAIIGHTCDIGSRDYNEILSVKRANSVKAYLMENGIDHKNIEVEGHGEREPQYPNTSDKNREQNRRVEILIAD